MTNTPKCPRCGGDKRVYYRQLGDFDTCTDCNGTGSAPVPAAPAPEGIWTCPQHGTHMPSRCCEQASHTPFGDPPIRADSQSAPAPEATRDAEAERWFAETVIREARDAYEYVKDNPLLSDVAAVRKARLDYVVAHAAQAREIETLRARAEKAERRLADANETARRLCRERDALLTAARDLLNAVERGCGVGGFPPWFGDQARALAALAARAPETQP